MAAHTVVFTNPSRSARHQHNEHRSPWSQQNWGFNSRGAAGRAVSHLAPLRCISPSPRSEVGRPLLFRQIRSSGCRRGHTTATGHVVCKPAASGTVSGRKTLGPAPPNPQLAGAESPSSTRRPSDLWASRGWRGTGLASGRNRKQAPCLPAYASLIVPPALESPGKMCRSSRDSSCLL